MIMADKMDQALLKAAVALLKRCEARLLQTDDMEDALHLLKLELPGVYVVRVFAGVRVRAGAGAQCRQMRCPAFAVVQVPNA